MSVEGCTFPPETRISGAPCTLAFPEYLCSCRGL